MSMCGPLESSGVTQRNIGVPCYQRIEREAMYLTQMQRDSEKTEIQQRVQTDVLCPIQIDKERNSQNHSEKAVLEREKISILSPLRYPGSKRRFAGYIGKTVQLNGIRPTLFVEPFAGGASVSLQLLNDGIVERIGLIDLDPLVAAFWHTVFFDTNWLIQQIETIKVTLEQWDTFKKAPGETRRDLALACLFLNRTSFSGILAPSVGPLGGRAQKSQYTIDCRFPRKTLIQRIEQAASLSDRVAFVWNTTWIDGLSSIGRMQQEGSLPQNILYYFDPPFFEKADQLYTYYFKDVDHRQLRDHLLTLEAPWILSYDASEQVDALYGQGNQGSAQVELLYSSSRTRVVEEVIISNLACLPEETRLWYRKDERRRKPPSDVSLNGNSHSNSDEAHFSQVSEEIVYP